MELDEEYYRKLNESEQRFYGIINEIRIQMGMATVEVPFYGPKISTAEAPEKPEAILEVPFVAIVEPNEDEIHPRGKNELQQQPFEETRDRPTPIDLEMDSHGANPAGPHVLDAPIEAERISGEVLADELHQQPESVSRIVVGEFDGPESTSVPYKLSEMSCIQGNQFGLFREKDPSMSKDLLSSSSLLQKSNLSCHEAIEDSVTKADENRQILYVSSMDSSPLKTEDGLHKIDATIDTSTLEIVPSNVVQMGDGLFLEAHNLLEEMPMGDGSTKLQEMELQKDEAKSCSCSPVAFSCEQLLAELPPPNQLLSRFGVHLDVEANSILQGKICEVLPSSEIGIGNVNFSELEFLEFDGMKCGGLARDCEKPDFHAFGVSLGSWNLDLHPQVVDGNVGSKAMEFRVMNQPFLNAHEVFDKLSVKEMGDYDGSVCFLSIFGDGFDYSSSFVFDPGKIIDFKVKWLTVEVRSAVEMVERGHRNVSFFVFDPGKNNNFLLHNGSLEALITLVFDPGGDQVLLRFVLENFPFGQACAGKSPFCLASHLGATEACLKTLGVMLNFCLQCAESSHIWTCADITH